MELFAAPGCAVVCKHFLTTIYMVRRAVPPVPPLPLPCGALYLCNELCGGVDNRAAPVLRVCARLPVNFSNFTDALGWWVGYIGCIPREEHPNDIQDLHEQRVQPDH